MKERHSEQYSHELTTGHKTQFQKVVLKKQIVKNARLFIFLAHPENCSKEKSKQLYLLDTRIKIQDNYTVKNRRLFLFLSATTPSSLTPY